MGLDAAALAAAAIQADRLKSDGNDYFKRKRFGAAIDAYTEAITLCPNVPVYWTNRALCHLKRNDWTRLEEDSRKALELDHKSVKAHYLMGLAFLRKEFYAEGIKQLERALDLGRGAKSGSSYMIETIWQELAKAKYLEWERASTKRSWDLQSLKEACEVVLKEKHSKEYTQSEGFVDELDQLQVERLDLLQQVFQKAAAADTPTEVPDYLCCKITLDIFRDPVITPSGVTYERAVILEHLQKVGKFDPLTHEPLNPSQLIPNLAIKAAVQAYLDEHGWAYRVD
ncbi:hypothetical protein SAY87_000874 [Trapa incisa]|uniref:E3 ubiquitin-protein ligase CHIP n=1 Tax=Trapa incisa TaxID=236973 RepID=A0AAN7GF88_9MYRT|nr:hypothetical protein SAY87_000874 [Trapa incisa]